MRIMDFHRLIDLSVKLRKNRHSGFELYPICQSALFASPQGVFREGFHGQIDVLI